MREKEFLDFNIDNIFINLYQTEDHLRRLNDTNNESGHASCVFKHLSFISGELGEAISHSSVVAPEKMPIFQEMQKETDSLRHNLQNLSVRKAIEKVRELRKSIEKLNPKYDTSKCKACGKIEKEIEKEINEIQEKSEKILNLKNPKNSMKKEFTTIIASQFASKGIQKGAEYLDVLLNMENNPVYARPSTWVNIAGGLGGILAGIYLFEDNPKMQLIAVIAGSGMLTKTIDYAQEMTK